MTVVEVAAERNILPIASSRASARKACSSATSSSAPGLTAAFYV